MLRSPDWGSLVESSKKTEIGCWNRSMNRVRKTTLNHVAAQRPPTKSSKFVCCNRHFPQSLGKSVCSIPVRAEKRTDDALKEAPAGVWCVKDLNRRDCAWQSRVLVKLMVFKVSRKLIRFTMRTLVSVALANLY